MKERQLSLEIVEDSGLPATLHHSIHACRGTWKNVSIPEFIRKYEKRRKQHPVIQELYFKHKPQVVEYLAKLEKLGPVVQHKKVKKVFKYGTGDVIPEGAVYLSTQVEKEHHWSMQRCESIEHNMFVWHYFLVEVEEET